MLWTKAKTFVHDMMVTSSCLLFVSASGVILITVGVSLGMTVIKLVADITTPLALTNNKHDVTSCHVQMS